MRFVLLGSMWVATIACGSASPSVTPVQGPEGASGYLEIRCPHDNVKCRELASASCPRGYDVVDFRGNQDRYSTPDTMSEPMGPPGAAGKLLVSCK
jgi:hypothetical protein